jgi:hypothetical protein
MRDTERRLLLAVAQQLYDLNKIRRRAHRLKASPADEELFEAIVALRGQDLIDRQFHEAQQKAMRGDDEISAG